MLEILAKANLQTANITLAILMIVVAAFVFTKPSKVATITMAVIALTGVLLAGYGSLPLSDEHRSQLVNGDDECIAQEIKKRPKFGQIDLLAARIRCNG